MSGHCTTEPHGTTDTVAPKGLTQPPATSHHPKPPGTTLLQPFSLHLSGAVKSPSLFAELDQKTQVQQKPQSQNLILHLEKLVDSS